MIGLFRTSDRTIVDDARPTDVSVLAAIHEKSFSRGWSAEELSALLADRRVVQGIVMRRGAVGSERVAGFVVLRSAGGEAEILTIAVEPRSRGRGYGRRLMEEVSRRLYRDRAESLFLEVDETNRPAVSLYRNLGFETVGQRKHYYRDSATGPGTALVMRLRLR
jgi:[ribosomal protein S18]-alanine N-acetyltransferase